MDNNIASQDFNEVFFNVRNAYRLLYVYQQRILDIVKFIGDHLSLRYEGGYSWFSNSTPKNGKGALNLWAWDWLNMYMYEFHFNVIKIDDNIIRFSIILLSDTGYFDAESKNKIDIGSFSTSENSSTKLIFLIGKNAWHQDFKDFPQNFTKLSVDYTRNSDKGKVLAKSFDIKNFLTPETSLSAVTEFVHFCQSNGIDEITELQLKKQ